MNSKRWIDSEKTIKLEKYVRKLFCKNCNIQINILYVVFIANSTRIIHTVII